jgi:uroporphyrinogen decarboxylase
LLKGDFNVNHRERFNKALAHQEPDRVPRDFGTTNATSIHIHAYQNLARYLGCDPEEYDWVSFAGQLVTPSEEILQKLNVDTRKVQFTSSPDHYEFIDENTIRGDYYGLELKAYKPPGGYYFDPIEFPLEDRAPTVEGLFEEYPVVEEDISEELDRLEAYAKWLHEETNYAVVGVCDFYPSPFFYLSLQTYLMYIASNPDYIAALTDLILENQFATTGKLLERIGPYVDLVYLMGEDYAGQNVPHMSPKSYRELFVPRQRRVVEFARQCTDAPLMMHQDGAIYVWILDIIDIGIDVLNPIQLSAKDMGDTARLKQEFGDKLAFLGGGIDTQSVLSFGTPAEVKAEVKRRIQDLAPGGGYVFSMVHDIQPEVPPENIMAMFEAVDKYGAYPIKT